MSRQVRDFHPVLRRPWLDIRDQAFHDVCRLVYLGQSVQFDRPLNLGNDINLDNILVDEFEKSCMFAQFMQKLGQLSMCIQSKMASNCDTLLVSTNCILNFPGAHEGENDSDFIPALNVVIQIVRSHG